MPPRRVKLHSSTGKLKEINKAYTLPSGPSNSNSTSASRPANGTSTTTQTSVPPPELSATQSPEMSTGATPASSHDSDADQQFELELYWCIQTLEKSIQSGSLSARQVADTEKTLKLLKSNNQPLVRKRQLMRTTFGDYRTKMQEEEKKMRLGTRQIQFVAEPAEKEAAKPKSFFVKKSLASSLGDANFKFEFPVPELEKLSIETQTTDAGSATHSSASSVDQSQAQSSSTSNSESASNALRYTRSDNSFRFNFGSQN